MTQDNDTQSDMPKNAIEQVVSRFIAGLPARIQAMQAAFSSSNWNELESLAHKLAGASIFGFPALGECARRLENSVLDKQIQDVSRYLQELIIQADEDGRIFAQRELK